MAAFNQAGPQVFGAQTNVGSGPEEFGEWRATPPKAEGWYWAEDDTGVVAMVFVQYIPKGAYWHVWNPLDRKEQGTDDFVWWYGPLTFSVRLRRRVNTEGGPSIGGSINVNGDFVGRDLHKG